MRLPREVWVLAVISFLSSIGLGIVVPSLPALGAEYSVGVTAMSVAISGFAAARLATNLGLTGFLRRLRLQPVLAAGLGFQGVTTVLTGFAADYTAFVVLRTLSGVGSAAFTIASTALMVAVAPSGRRGRAMSLAGGLTGLGTVSGPAVGGALVAIDPHLPFSVYGSSLCLASIITLVLLHRARSIRTADTSSSDVDVPGVPPRASTLALLFGDPRFVMVVVCQAVQGTIFYGIRSAILPAYLEGLGYALTLVGVLLTVGALSQLAGTTVSGATSDRIGRFPVLVAAFAFAIVSFVLLLFAEPLVVGVLAFAALGIAGGLQHSTASALLADSRGGRTAAAAGMFWMTFDLFAVIGPVVGGIVAETWGFEWVLYGSIGALSLALAYALVAWGATRDPQRRS